LDRWYLGEVCGKVEVLTLRQRTDGVAQNPEVALRLVEVVVEALLLVDVVDVHRVNLEIGRLCWNRAYEHTLSVRSQQQGRTWNVLLQTKAPGTGRASNDFGEDGADVHAGLAGVVLLKSREQGLVDSCALASGVSPPHPTQEKEIKKEKGGREGGRDRKNRGGVCVCVCDGLV
jgi:hypothetical protein